ncbi:MAG: hypothetical protein IT261_00885 [Saprospiraceae bacterium]|nr:hypothetical protein [Saprospiraceae bacterium]
MKQFSMSRKGLFSCVLLIAAALWCASCEKDEDTKPTPTKWPLKLEYMEVVEIPLAGELHLYGYFGDSSATSRVVIDGSPLPEATPGNLGSRILSWKPWHVVCQIPAVTDPMGKGTVQVQNKGLASNTRKLTAWQGEIRFRRPDEGTLEREVLFEVLLRADADPHQYATPRQPASHFASGSKAHYSLGGQGTSTYGSDCQVTLIARLDPASGTIYPRFPLTDGPGLSNYFRSLIRFRNQRFEVEVIDVFKEKVSTLTMTSIYCPATSVATSEHNLYGPPYELQTFQLELDPATKKIKPGKLTHTGSTEVGLIWDEWGVPQYECTMEWEVMQVL